MITPSTSLNRNPEKCAICDTHRAWTAEGQLFPLAARGPKGDWYVRYICEECVRLFRRAHWPKVRKLLRTLRPGRYGVSHRAASGKGCAAPDRDSGPAVAPPGCPATAGAL